MSGSSAAHMKASKKRVHQRDLKGGEIVYCCALFFCRTLLCANTCGHNRTVHNAALAHHSVTKSLSCILTNTYADGRQKRGIHQKPSEIWSTYQWIHSISPNPFSIPWVQTLKWESITTIKISLRAECAECSHLFIRRRIDRNLSYLYFKRNNDIGSKSAFDLEAGLREGLFSIIAFQMPFGLGYAPWGKRIYSQRECTRGNKSLQTPEMNHSDAELQKNWWKCGGMNLNDLRFHLALVWHALVADTFACTE